MTAASATARRSRKVLPSKVAGMIDRTSFLNVIGTPSMAALAMVEDIPGTISAGNRDASR